MYTFFYKHNNYKHIEAEISEKSKHIVSIFWGWEKYCKHILRLVKINKVDKIFCKQSFFMYTVLQKQKP